MAIRAAQPNSLAGVICRPPAASGGGMSALPPAIAAEIAAAGRSQLEFDDNLLLPALYGERDQHLDRIERQLGVSLVPRGNRLSIAGPASATEVARLALSRLYERLKRGQEIDIAAVEAALRLAQAEIDDKSLSLWREDAGFRTRKRRIAPRSRRPGRATSRRCASTSWCSGSAPPAPARPISRSPPRSIC